MHGNWQEEIIRFWFEEVPAQNWFMRNDALDQTIRTRFLPLYEDVVKLPVSAALTSARHALATVIVLDQFPRNMFRGSPRAFATDALALEVAQHAIEASLDQQLDLVQKVFLYMPFQHCESRTVQARSIELLSALAENEFTPYAWQHKEVIDRFGRFPHRNAVLGRVSTPEEIEYLRTHPGF